MPWRRLENEKIRVVDSTVRVIVLAVDNQGFVRADGVCLGRLTSDRTSLTVVDKDRRRSAERGSRYVVVPLTELTKLTEKK